MENNESIQEAAAREAREEAMAESKDLSLHGLYALKHVNQVYALYHGELCDGRAEPGSETLEVGLYEESEIPWREIAFLVIKVALEDFLADRKAQSFRLHQGDLFKNERNELLYSVAS